MNGQQRQWLFPIHGLRLFIALRGEAVYINQDPSQYLPNNGVQADAEVG